ncbi:MAG: transcription antitermination factor NusB [Microthrixaceae bacterium]|nr:transcription antitermination factor NusB [Microthrixaceae bacterium]MCO5314052.1 transcription antitermination factor NusB [Microthrixaceae bacterium]HPB46671.1 transcription antitermination factor NusB [Microthrixaceae bacterium]
MANSYSPGFVPSEPGRHEARERAVALGYEAEQRDLDAAGILDDQILDPDPYTVALVAGVGEHLEEIDTTIERFARGWTLERMAAMDRAVLRVAIFELAHREDIPTPVVIDEAVELAKRYGTDDSSRFVNGVLDSAANALRSTGS